MSRIEGLDEGQSGPLPTRRPGRGQTVAYLVLAGMALFVVVPFTWLILAAVDAQASIFVKVPETWTLDNFRNLFVDQDGFRLILNSIIYAGGATIVLIVSTTMAGYVLSRFTFPGRRPLMLGVLLIRVIPPTATIAPLYVIATDLGLLNTYRGVILILAALEAPLVLWIMKGFFDTVPIEIEEAAWVDGASRLGALFRIVLPLAGPGVAAAGLIGFIGAWNQFLVPLVLISDQDKVPVSIGLFRAWVSYTRVDWGFLAALAIVYVIPAIVFYVVARRAMQASLAGSLAGT
jgi:ABC-type glycerol-3-phosphate transport system permease component